MTATAPTWTATPTAGLQLNSVAVTPDGTRCVCGTSNEFSTGEFGLYCYDGSGNLLWNTAVTGANAVQGVFWVAISANKAHAAAGGETADGVGFLTVCDGATGAVVFNLSPRNDKAFPGRVNQLSFSKDGSLLLVGFGNQVRMYVINNGQFSLGGVTTIGEQYDCISALISDDGSAVWMAAINYGTTPYSGLVQAIPVSGGTFGTVSSYTLASGAMRIAVTADGNHAAAALHTGECALFSINQTATPVWTYTPNFPNVSLAYAVAITQTSAGNIVVACGTNQTSPSESGYLYVVDTQQSGTPPVPTPNLRWNATLQYSANPGVCLDKEGTWVTATDGKPKEKAPDGSPKRVNPDGTINESPGNFYLYTGAGVQQWQYPTPIMNWPMVITPDGSTVLGGSDDGTLYYWNNS